MSRTVELTARYESERYRFANPESTVVIGAVKLVGDSKSIAREHGIRDPHGYLSIKGELVDPLELGSTYRFLGTFSNYTNKRTGITEKQLHFRTYVQHVPQDAEGIARYLCELGKGCGIGPAKSKKLVERFGVEDALETCRTNPDLVSVVASIDLELAHRFAEKLDAQKETQTAKIELDRLLSGKGFPRSLAGRLIKEYGNTAAQRVTADPYILMNFRGVGFRLADKLYMELGKDPSSVDRQALYLWYSMASDTAGHSWFPAEHAVKQLQNTIGRNVDYRAAIIRGREYGQVSDDHYGAIASIRTDGVDGPLRSDGSTLWLAEGKVASQESRLAELIVDAMTEAKDQRLTIYGDCEVIEEIPATVARCHRCGRALTADIVHVIDGLPYGPTCVEKVAK